MGPGQALRAFRDDTCEYFRPNLSAAPPKSTTVTPNPSADLPKRAYRSMASSIRCKVGNSSASPGGLSHRIRLIRGNRIATPDLCLGER